MSPPTLLAKPVKVPERVRRKMPRRVLPGFGLSFGITLSWLAVIVLIPLAGLTGKALQPLWVKGLSAGGAWLWTEITAPPVMASYWCSFGLSFFAAIINGFF